MRECWRELDHRGAAAARGRLNRAADTDARGADRAYYVYLITESGIDVLM